MTEIRCPKCGEVFQVDEAGYAEIVRQVRDREFHKEVEAQREQFRAERESAVKLAEATAAGEQAKVLAERDNRIAVLEAQLAAGDTEKKLAVQEARAESERALSKQNEEIRRLTGLLENQKTERALSEQNLRTTFEQQLAFKDEEIQRYKDFKVRLSTKMVGESLEQHCLNAFNSLRATGFRSAYFEKDNDARTGSKGDFIFRDYAEDGTEFISIMFEMKNEADTTATKHKNEDFFKELDKDRREKGCEYAVLVSMLEPDSEYYNAGIVDVSHKYEKMYVVRPQFFIPIITLLRNAAMNSLKVRQELSRIRSQNIDITRFEDDMNEFKAGFSRSVRLAGQNFQKAMDEIDKTIDHLQKTREALRLTRDQLTQANNKAEDLSIKRLTRNNPTMAAMFAELEEQKEE